MSSLKEVMLSATGRSSISLIFVGFVEESNAEYHTLPEYKKVVFKAAEAATSGAGNEG